MNSVPSTASPFWVKPLLVSQQQLATAWRNASRMGFFGILVAVLLYILLLRELSNGNSALWLVVVVTLSSARLLLGVYYTRSVENAEEIMASLKLYIVMTAVVSMAWGSAIFLLDAASPLVVTLIISVSIALVSIVGMLGSFSIFMGALAYILPISGLQIVWVLLNQPPYFVWISALMAVFTLVMAALSLTLCKQYRKLLGLIDENAGLVQNLTTTNSRLSEKIAHLEEAELFAASFEHRFQSLVETAPDAILVTDGEGLITFANQACLSKFGYLKEELIGKPIEILVPERFKEHRLLRERFVEEANYSRMGKEREVFCLRKDGEEFAAEITLMPECINSDQLVYVYIRDISGQKYIDAIIHEIREKELVQGELQSEKERLHTYVDNIEVVLVVVNENMQVELINRKGRELLNIKDGSILNTHQLGGLLQRSYHEKTDDFLRQVFGSEDADNRFYRNSIVTVDGETHYFEWHLAQAQGADKRRYILASGTDISKRKRLEELITSVAVSLHNQTDESLLNSLVKSLANTLDADNAIIARIDGSSRTRLESLALWSNGRIANNISITVDGTPYENILLGQSHSILDKLDEKYPNEELISSFGAKSYVAVPLLNPKREVIGMLALFFRHALGNINLERNICNIYSVIAAAEIERVENERDKKQIHRQLQQAQKMESIGQLTGGVAHDFNNMLASILGFTELALYKVGDGDEKLVQYLTNVHDTGEQAKELVSQMLTFSRQVRGEMQPLDIRSVVEEAIKMVRPMLPSSIGMDIHIANDLPCIDGDPVLLNQSILNLIINARDAIGEKGNIGIRVGLKHHAKGVCTSCLQNINGEMIEIGVSDDGGGITYEQLERIFEPFVTDKDIGKGTGMGLAMVHGIVHEHGGHVVAKTTRGQGSIFTLYLPVSTKRIMEEGSNSMINESSTLDGSGRLVMVVDDEVMVATLLDEILSSYNYSVEVYNSSTDALDAYKSDPDKYDLVISDHTMPNMTGAELSQNILQINSGQPIILCTGYSDYINEEKAEELGIAAFMHKPLDHAELMHTVDMLTSVK
jgi:PAS domain S-box-containing protein